MDSKSIYRSFCEENRSIPLFSSPEWLDITAPNWEVVISKSKDSSVAATFPYFIKNIRNTFSAITLPYLTPYSGPSFYLPRNPLSNYRKNSFISSHLHNLLNQIPKKDYIDLNIYPYCTNAMAASNLGYQISTRYTQIIPSLQNTNNSYSKNVIKRLNKFEGSYDLEFDLDPGELLNLIQLLFKRKDINQELPKSIFLNLSNYIINNGIGKILGIRINNHCELAALMVFDNDTAYLLISGSTNDVSKSGMVSILYHECIRFAQNQGMQKFDFCGSMIPEVEIMNRSFGPIQVPYLHLYKATPLIRLLRNK